MIIIIIMIKLFGSVVCDGEMVLIIIIIINYYYYCAYLYAHSQSSNFSPCHCNFPFLSKTNQ